MTPHQRAIIMLPDVPNDVFDFFILPFIDGIGWPFSNVSDRTEGTSWWELLGGLSIKEFSELKWQRHQFLILDCPFHPESNADINRLIRHHVDGNETSLIRNIRNSKERFLWHIAYIKRTRNLFAPIVAIVTFNGIRVLDGTHRLAALLSSGLHNEVPVIAWIGSGS